MKWPRGKYNGKRIVGFDVKVRCDVTHWRLRLGSIHYGSAACIGPFMIWIGANYEF